MRTQAAERIQPMKKVLCALTISMFVGFTGAAAVAQSSPNTSGPAAKADKMVMRGDNAYQQQAQKILSQIKRELGGVHRAQLTRNSSLIYAEASDLTNEGFKALHANDNLAALGFAEKAQLLTANLGQASAAYPSRESGRSPSEAPAFFWTMTP